MKCGSLSERNKISDRNSVGKIGQGNSFVRYYASVGDLSLTKIRVENFLPLQNTTRQYFCCEVIILLFFGGKIGSLIR